MLSSLLKSSVPVRVFRGQEGMPAGDPTHSREKGTFQHPPNVDPAPVPGTAVTREPRGPATDSQSLSWKVPARPPRGGTASRLLHTEPRPLKKVQTLVPAASAPESAQTTPRSWTRGGPETPSRPRTNKRHPV